MQIIEVNDREKLSSLVIQELKEIGVKYRKDKKIKPSLEKTCRKRIFRTHLHLLELTDVILASGSVVQIPRFVADACNRILEHVETEGLFRKAGSSLRQKEIRISLEAGLPLGKTHHVIDVANVVKSFFRELPEPLIPSYIQETLLRSLLIGDNRIKAILLAILLLPPLTINTLSFFLQFLNTVSLYSHMNKMPVENLAIIFTPGLMPFPDIASLRFNNHVKMVQLLIENAHAIGTVPECIVDKLHIHEIFSKTSGKSKSVEALDVKKKKKRRSGSLTQMFNGLRKMVGGAIGSAENLGHTPELTKTPPMAKNPVAATPCLSKSSKKRKFADPVCAFSAKKKKDLLALLPSNSGGFLPNTPLIKEPKKNRLSLGGRRQTKKTSPAAPALPSMERRWSIVGSGWPRNKKSDKKEPTSTITKPLSPVASMPCISKLDFPRIEFPVIEQTSFVDSSVPDSTTDVEKNTSETSDNEFVRVPKNYYESIIERVSAIETRMSQEFGKIQSSLSSGDDLDLSIKKAHLSNDDRLNCSMSGLERVLNEYEQTKEETERLTSPYTENLAKRLSRELKIRRSSENRVIRSPSARKIGTMRRRSREAARLTRNKTWHDSSTSEKPPAAKQVILYPPKPTQDFCTKCNLKRGRPNTLHTGLPQQCTPVDDKKTNFVSPTRNTHIDEKWTAGEVFFDAKKPHNFDMEHKPLEECIPSTPVAAKPEPEPFAEMKTPMLPPRSIRRKAMGNNRTPASAMRLVSTRILATPGEDEINGRASIARLRTQNAGMVMAKAKLFDGLGGNENENIPPATPTTTTSNRRRSIRLPAPPLNLKNKIEEVKLPPTDESPSVRKKNTTKSPGYIQKRQRLCLAAKMPSKQFLDTMVNEDNLLSKMSPINVSLKNISNQNRYSNSPRTPKTRTNHFGGVNSPRRGRNPNSAAGSRRRTPHKVNTPAGTRKSPRYVNAKATGRT